MGPMHHLMDFLDYKSIITLQKCNKRCYEALVPQYEPAWPILNKFFNGMRKLLKEQCSPEAVKAFAHNKCLLGFGPAPKGYTNNDRYFVEWKLNNFGIYYQGEVNRASQEDGRGTSIVPGGGISLATRK
jgi:hypothetical protein